MKKITTLLGCLALMLSVVTVSADNIDETQARNAAVAYLASVRGQKVPDLASARLVKTYINPATGDNALYIFNVGNDAYAVVSGSTATKPVLAYSDEDTLDISYLTDDSPMGAWYQSYADMVSEAQVENLAASDQQVASDWQSLSEGQVLSRLAPTKAISNINLVQTIWDQGKPYNDSIPTVDGGKRGYVGCVSLAMAMIMRYWEYPVKPMGSFRQNVYGSTYVIDYDSKYYDYSLMPNDLNKANVTDAQRAATAQFIYNASLSCSDQAFGANAGYASDGTSSNTQFVVRALTDHFKYSGFRVVNRADMTNDEWVSLMKSEILAGRPIYYSARDTTAGGGVHAGHAFVVGGYKFSTGEFRVNWGWGKDGAGPTWCDMNDVRGLKTHVGGTSYVYEFSQQAVINIMPPADSIHISLPDPSTFPADAGTNAILSADQGATFDAVYPSPATLSVTIPYTLRDAAEAQLDIYNVQGKLMQSLRVTADQPSATLSVAGYPSGIYTCRLRGASTKFVVK